MALISILCALWFTITLASLQIRLEKLETMYENFINCIKQYLEDMEEKEDQQND